MSHRGVLPGGDPIDFGGPLIYRGAITAAEDRSDFDARSPHSAAMQVVLRHGDTPPPTETHPTATVIAEVIHGRWMAKCPWCASAQVASREDRRFFCVECLNVRADGKWARVVWPEQADEIEAVLAMRPSKETRSWLAHESLGDLLRENQTNGVM